MKRLGILVLYLLLAIVAAGLFGAVHDQISYSVSPEYFTRFKFLQFHLSDSPLPERLRVALVGVMASWWMGIPLGLFAGMAGLIQRSAAQMLRALLWSLPALVGFTLAVALIGLLYGVIQTRNFDMNAYAGWYIPRALENPRRFLCAGYMHNAAYIGGALAIPAAWVFHILCRRRWTRRPLQ